MSTARSMQGRIVEFVGRLRSHGMPIGVDQVSRFSEALSLVQPLSRSEVYHAARATLLTEHAQIPIFDRVFAEFWEPGRAPRRPQKTPRAPRHRPEDFRRPSLVSFMAQRASATDREIDVPDRSQTATATETLRRKDFSRLTEAEQRAVERVMAAMRWDFSQRRSHRLERSARGPRLDYRDALRRAARLGGVTLELPRRVRKEKARPLVLLADVSGSMELYSRIVLQFFYAVSRKYGKTEAFVFGTRLTRVTEALAHRKLELALDAVSDEVADFAGGTRIAESLHSFRRQWAPRVLGRGAVVIVISDGCETGDATALGREVEALRRACYRLIWLNPRLGQADYEPRVRGMAAALPHVDDFLSIHNLESLQQLRDHLADLPRRKGAAREASWRL